MTAQIAILNKVAVALASDSAMTVEVGGHQKIFTSSNKLFRLTRNHPIGIMVYGNAELIGVPWEAIIKTYREQLRDQSFTTLSECASNFLHFLDGNNNTLFPQEMQDSFVRDSIGGYFAYIAGVIEEKARSIIEGKGGITKRQVETIVSLEIDRNYRRWKQASVIETIPEDHGTKIISKFGSQIEGTIRKVFQRLPLSRTDRMKLRDLAQSICTKRIPESINHEQASGVVIAGFGNDEVFPSLQQFDLDGIVEGKLRYWKDKDGEQKIGVGGSAAAISSFAQKDMIVAFMEGINPIFSQEQDKELTAVFRDYTQEAIKLAQTCGCVQPSDVKRLRIELGKLRNSLKRNADQALARLRRRLFIDPVISVVAMLPKDELAAMAESLVNLTSFQRRVSLESETVGGAIDVAVISKGDGFVWIKRKFYFDPKLNPSFIANYYRDVQNER